MYKTDVCRVLFGGGERNDAKDRRAWIGAERQTATQERCNAPLVTARLRMHRPNIVRGALAAMLASALEDLS